MSARTDGAMLSAPAIQRARQTGYLVSTAPAMLDEWFAETERADQPYVTIRRRRVYATVSLDMIGTTRKLSETAILRAHALLEKYAEPRAHIIAGPRDLYCDRVRIERAEELAARLVLIARIDAGMRRHDAALLVATGRKLREAKA